MTMSNKENTAQASSASMGPPQKSVVAASPKGLVTSPLPQPSLSAMAAQAAQAQHDVYGKAFGVSAVWAASQGRKEQEKKDEFRADLNVRLICPDCQEWPPQTTEEFSSGDLVCASCGYVLGDRVVDTRSEWRTFANEDGDDPSRVGQASNPLYDGVSAQLDTQIGFRDGNSGVARDLQRTANRAAGASNRALADAFDDIQRKCDQIHLSRSVTDVAKQLFKRVEEEKILRGKRTEAIVAAVIFIACRRESVPRTFPEICALTSVSKKHIGKCFKEIQQAFGLNVSAQPSDATGGAADQTASGTTAGVLPTSALDLVGRFCNYLGLKPPFPRLIETIATTVRDQGILAGRSPVTIAAACIHFATTLAGQPKSAKAISKAAGVSDVTIKNSYKDLLKHKDAVLTDELMKKYANLNPDPSNLL